MATLDTTSIFGELAQVRRRRNDLHLALTVQTIKGNTEPTPEAAPKKRLGSMAQAALRMFQAYPRRRMAARAHGFTLVEMLLVLVILATLAAIVIPKFAGRGEQAKQTAAQTQISNIEGALDAFEVDTGAYPKDLSELLEEPKNAKSWRGPYLKQAIGKDPWGQNVYVYEYPGKHNAKGYDLYSSGPDSRPGTDDDITNWKVEGAKDTK